MDWVGVEPTTSELPHGSLVTTELDTATHSPFRDVLYGAKNIFILWLHQKAKNSQPWSISLQVLIGETLRSLP